MIQIDFTGRNIEVTEAMKTRANGKLQRLARRNQKITRIHITFYTAGISQIAEANMFVHGTEIHAKGEDENMYNAIDRLIDRLIVQLAKFNEKSR